MKTKAAGKKSGYVEGAISDDLNPLFILSGVFTQLLTRVANGEVDCQALAKLELANRGLDLNGKWVGYNNDVELNRI